MVKIKKGLLLEGILSAILATLMFFVVGINNAMYLLTIPFESLGKVLRSLSLSSGIGNITAIFFYVAFSLIPVLYLIRKRKKSGLQQVDFLLPVISIYCFYMLYMFVNPGLMINRVPLMLANASIFPVLKMSFVIIFYSLCIGYIILSLASTLSAFKSEDKSTYLSTRLQWILIFVSALYTFFLGYFSTFQVFVNIRKYSAEDSSTLNLAFVVMKFILEGLPVVCVILILLAGVMLLKTMTANHMSEEEIKAANQMGLISIRAVYVTVMSNISLNIIQFLLSTQLNNTNYNLEISLFPLIIAFAAMILSGYFTKAKNLYEDNQMII